MTLMAFGCGGKTEVSADSLGETDAGSTGPDAAMVSDAGKDAAGPTIVPEQGQKILFEVSRVNFAWGVSITGAFITVEGRVYRYDYYGTSSPDGATPYIELTAGMTEEQVTAKHGSQAVPVTMVEQASLLAHFAMLAQARNGALLTQSGCADYGADRYVGYVFDAGTKLYTPVPLGTDGDLAVRNTAGEGELLITWMRELLGEGPERSCQYRAEKCEGAMCPGTPPCAAGNVPMTWDEQGCLDNCGSPSRCGKVESCNVCKAAGAACVVGGDGVAHCVDWVPGCAGTDVTCACGGNDVCAAGGAQCQGSSETGLSCATP